MPWAAQGRIGKGCDESVWTILVNPTLRPLDSRKRRECPAESIKRAGKTVINQNVKCQALTGSGIAVGKRSDKK